jgi:hypothetical protein
MCKHLILDKEMVGFWSYLLGLSNTALCATNPLNKPGLMGLSNMGLDNCVRSRVEQRCLMNLSDMGLNRLFNPMSDKICLMSFYSSDRLFNSFESIAEQTSDEFSLQAGQWPAWQAQFASRSMACSASSVCKQVTGLLGELSLQAVNWPAWQTEFASRSLACLAN